MYELEDITEEKQEFSITDDLKAEWAVKIIKQEEAETQRLIDTIDQEIELLKVKKEQLQEQLANKTGFLKSKLADYFETVEKKELKTCFKYKLPSADLVFVKPTVKYERDNDKIISWLTENNKFDYIKKQDTIQIGILSDILIKFGQFRSKTLKKTIILRHPSELFQP